MDLYQPQMNICGVRWLKSIGEVGELILNKLLHFLIGLLDLFFDDIIPGARYRRTGRVDLLNVLLDERNENIWLHVQHIVPSLYWRLNCWTLLHYEFFKLV